MTTASPEFQSEEAFPLLFEEASADGDFFLSLSRFFAVCELFESSSEPTTYQQAAEADPLAFSKLSDLQRQTVPQESLYDWPTLSVDGPCDDSAAAAEFPMPRAQ